MFRGSQETDLPASRGHTSSHTHNNYFLKTQCKFIFSRTMSFAFKLRLH